MKKYKLTGRQYELVREGLEHLYYICKDEGDKKKLKEITDLEESFIDQELLNKE